MSLYGTLDNATGNNKPKYANTSSVFGVSATEAANTSGDGSKIAHSGWVQQTLGTGSIETISITSGGEGYSNGFLAITGGGGSGANASATVDANGVIIAVTLHNAGSGFTSVPTAKAVGANTSAATLVATVGGRAGRRFYETLVAGGAITGDDTADNTYFPGT